MDQDPFISFPTLTGKLLLRRSSIELVRDGKLPDGNNPKKGGLFMPDHSILIVRPTVYRDESDEVKVMLPLPMVLECLNERLLPTKLDSTYEGVFLGRKISFTIKG